MSLPRRTIHLRELLENNKAWAERMGREHPGFFDRSVAQHAPQFLWIGCSDARVPANEIVGLAAGELFVHRNVANIVVPEDLNLLAVLEFAVNVLAIPHIIVCGHYGCNGVESSWRGQATGSAREWLSRVESVGSKHAAALASCADDEAELDRLCELNVLEQAGALCHTAVVQSAWERGLDVCVHGWIYSLGDGLIYDLGFRAESAADAARSYESALAAITAAARGPVSPS